MKKQLYLLLFLCSSTLLTAQSGLRVGAHNGLHFSTLQFSGSDALDVNSTTQPLLGYRVGIMLEIPIHARFCLRTGGDFLLSGTKQDLPFSAYTSKLKVYSFQAPVMLAYSCQYFFVGAGGYGSIAWMGTFEATINKNRSVYSDLGVPNFKTLTFGSSANNDFSRLDYGMIAELGLRYKYFELSGYYLHGIRNINPAASEYRVSVRNRSVGISLSLICTL
ncbi:MAG: porin family protein [Saprospiraceae bacterium]|nr:porin family protein [Saprospiraceae bacterium]